MDITFKQVEDEVRRLVAENPEFVYVPPTDSGGDCVYLERDKEDSENGRREWRGSCLFGRVFLNLMGKDAIPQIRECEDQICGSLFSAFSITVTDQQALWAAEVQAQQDKSLPWGECLKVADATYPLEEGR